MKYNLATFSNSWYQPGPIWKIILWQLTSQLFFETFFPWSSSLKRKILHIFGASIGIGVVIKPHVQIKYPWFLSVGEYSWIGEHVWIDNLGQVTIGNHSILSQGVYLCTGNHNFKMESFDLMIGEITIGSSTWIGAKSIISPGVIIGNSIIVTIGSVVKNTISKPGIYVGHPAIFVKPI